MGQGSGPIVVLLQYMPEGHCRHLPPKPNVPAAQLVGAVDVEVDDCPDAMAMHCA